MMTGNMVLWGYSFSEDMGAAGELVSEVGFAAFWVYSKSNRTVLHFRLHM